MISHLRWDGLSALGTRGIPESPRSSVASSSRQSESGCTFTFDFSKVYWNSRLQHEHDRLIDLLPVGSVVADVMAGVGPFAVPAAKKGCYVLGNDLNPESVRWMRENQAKNKVRSADERIQRAGCVHGANGRWRRRCE